MNRKGVTFQPLGKHKKDDESYLSSVCSSKFTKPIVFLLGIIITVLIYGCLRHKSLSLDERSEEYIEERVGESAASIELNKLEGNFTIRQLKRRQLEEEVRKSVLESTNKNTLTKLSNSVMILYAYSETPSSRANMLFFLKHGLHASADFIFIINGKTNIESIIPKDVPNIRIIRRENTCYDLGAYGEILRNNDWDLVSKYKYFILMNSSIRGPFLPTWSKDCWTNLYLNRLSDKVKLVGMSYNCSPKGHVQSMIIATDVAGIKILLKGDSRDTANTTDILYAKEFGNPESLLGLSSCYMSRYKAVSAEISLTNLINQASYNVSVIMTAGSSYLSYDEYCSDHNEFEWMHVHPYETLFIKANRDIHLDPSIIKKITDLHYKQNYSSWDVCSAI